MSVPQPCRGDCVCFDAVGKCFRTPARGEVHALCDVTLTCLPGEITCVLGPSGCGKTSLLRLAAGLASPTRGTVRVAGCPAGATNGSVTVGMVSQEGDLLPWYSVGQNIALGLQVRGASRARRQAQVEAMLEKVGLDRSVARSLPHELSGGMRQRVAIARAMAVDPQVLLMDEPFAGLDEPTRHRLQRQLVVLWRSHRRTLLFVTHSMEEASYLADRIVVMTAGRVVAELTIDLPRPRDRMSDAFIARLLEVRKTFASCVDDAPELGL
ncbi:MAG: ABC transporter ATP-binding protein [Phycisphaerae bacterium]